MKTITAAWVLKMMIAIQPVAPWRDTYERTADAIAEASNDTPLFDGDDGPARTGSLLVAIAEYESSFNPRAIGDKKRSYCLGQIHNSNHAALGVTADALLDDVKLCVRTMVRMARTSMRICASHPLVERLSQYASGGGECIANDKGIHRMRRAMWLFSHFPGF